MSDTEDGARADVDDTGGRQLNPDMKDPRAGGVPRRRLLESSAVVGAAATLSGCVGGGDQDGGAPTVYVFNTGDRTISVVDAENDELVDTTFLGTTSSFPANQYGTSADDDYDTLWLNPEGGVTAIDQRSLDVVAEVETGFGPNYPNLTPDGRHLIVAAGGGLSMDPDPDDPQDQAYVRVDADRDSDTFGEVTGRVDVGYDGPCDMTMGPDGEYAYAVDVNNDTLSVLRIDPFEMAARIDVGESVVDGGKVLPFMCTAGFDGELLLVENGEGELGPDGERQGSESIWDISDPENPEEVDRITRDDGLPSLPITSEIDPDGETAYLFTPGGGTVTVLDLEAREVADRLDVGGSTLAGAWGPSRDKLYVPVQNSDRVAVIDRESRDVAGFVDVGSAPVGIVAGMVRPDTDATGNIQAALTSLGIYVGDMEKTYCYPECFCGMHQ